MLKIAIACLVMTIRPAMGATQTLGDQILSSENIQELSRRQQESQARKDKLRPTASQSCYWTSPPAARCVATGHGLEFLQPYPAAIEPDLRGMEYIFSWAPESSVDHGKSTVARLQDLAVSHSPLVCYGAECTVVVKASEENGRQALAACKALRIEEQYGPPHKCWVVAIRLGAEWWLRVIDSTLLRGPSFYMAPIYTLEIRGLPRSSVLASLDQALAQPPLAMPDRTLDQSRGCIACTGPRSIIMAVAPKRFSKVLSGAWFEWPQILIELDQEYGIKVSLDLVVNKQNTADPADWHLPTDQQQEEFRGAVVRAIRERLNNVCVKQVWNGSGSLRCNQLRTENGSLVEIPEGASRRSREETLDPRVVRK